VPPYISLLHYLLEQCRDIQAQLTQGRGHLAKDKATQVLLLEVKDILVLEDLLRDKVILVPSHKLRDIQGLHHKDILELGLDQVLHLKDIQELHQDKDIEGVLLLHLTRAMVVGHLKDTEELPHQEVDMEADLLWMLKFNSGSMQWIRTEVGRSTLRNFNEH